MSKPPLPFPRGARTVGKTTFLLVALLTVAVVVGLFVWVVIRSGNQPQGAQFLVAYRVNGSATQATVVYDRPDGQHSEHSETVYLPWSTSFDTGSARHRPLWPEARRALVRLPAEVDAADAAGLRTIRPRTRVHVGRSRW